MGKAKTRKVSNALKQKPLDSLKKEYSLLQRTLIRTMLKEEKEEDIKDIYKQDEIPVHDVKKLRSRLNDIAYCLEEIHGLKEYSKNKRKAQEKERLQLVRQCNETREEIGKKKDRYRETRFEYSSSDEDTGDFMYIEDEASEKDESEDSTILIQIGHLKIPFPKDEPVQPILPEDC